MRMKTEKHTVRQKPKPKKRVVVSGRPQQKKGKLSGVYFHCIANTFSSTPLKWSSFSF